MSAISLSRSSAIEENSFVPKLVSALPLVGLFCQAAKETSLARKLESTVDVPLLIELLHLKNEYKCIGIARNIVTAAWIIEAIASGIFTGIGYLSIMVGGHLLTAGIMLFAIRHNVRVINELRMTGFRAGMIFE